MNYVSELASTKTYIISRASQKSTLKNYFKNQLIDFKRSTLSTLKIDLIDLKIDFIEIKIDFIIDFIDLKNEI